MKTAVLYARVSDPSQAEEEVSIPAQVAAGEKRAEGLDAGIVRVFKEEGRSAFKEKNRAAFEAAIDFAVVNKVDYFITWSSSRFARNKFEAVYYKRELARAGTDLVYTSVNTDLKTDEGWLYDSMMEVFDEMKSRDTSKDTRRSLLYNAQQGFFVGGLPPFGYASVPAPENDKRRKLVVVPEEAARVRDVFSMRLAGFGAKAIADKFNAHGIRYRGRPWRKAAVLDLLRNQALIGRQIFNRYDPRTKKLLPESDWIVLQTHEPIVDIDTWNEVRDLLRELSSSKESMGSSVSTHAFTGLLRCGSCGGSMTLETATGRGGRYSYYACRRAKVDGACTVRRYKSRELDAYLLGIVVDRILDPVTVSEMVASMVEFSGRLSREGIERSRALAAKLGTVKARNAKLYEILELHGIDAPNLGDLTTRIRANNEEAKALEREIRELEAAPAPLSIEGVDLGAIVRQLRELIQERAGTDQARAMLAGFIHRVVIDGGQASIEYDAGELVDIALPVHSWENWGRSASALRTRVLAVRLPRSVLATRRRLAA